MPRSLSVLLLGWLLIVPGVQASPEYQVETRITNSVSSPNQVMLDGEPGGGALYALTCNLVPSQRVSWSRSTDGGHSWQQKYLGQFGGERSFEFEYSRGEILRPIWVPDIDRLQLLRFSAATGLLGNAADIFSETEIVRWIVIETNDEGDPTPRVVVAAITLSPVLQGATLKVFRSTDGGIQWSAPVILATGPDHVPDHFGDLDLLSPTSGSPGFYLFYEQGGGVFVAKSTNGGGTWASPQALPLTVAAGTEFSAVGAGGQVAVAAQSVTGAVVCSATTDAGTTWSSQKVIDAPEGGSRLPSLALGGGLYRAFYRKLGGTIAYRTSTQPWVDGSWSSELVASLGTTSQPFGSFAVGGDAGIDYLNDDDGGLPYYAGEAYTPQLAPEGATEVASALRVFPQPSTGLVTILAPRLARPLSAWVLDAAGRRIATVEPGLVGGSKDGGAQSYLWNGRDESDRRVAPGVYYFRIPGSKQSAPMTIVR